MPIYYKTEGGWKTVLLMWIRQASGWSMVNPLYIKKSEVRWEALPFGTMLAPAITGPANGYVLKAGNAVVVSVSAISSSGFADAGSGTQIQIATDTGFANIVSAYDGAYTTSWTSAALSTVTTYYVRARHKGANLGWGPWSAYAWFSVAAVMGTAGFSSSSTWTAPYDGTFTIFVCGGGGGGGGGGDGSYLGTSAGGAGGDSSVYTLSGTAVSIAASGGAGGGAGGGKEDDPDGGTTYYNGTNGASSSWYSGGAGGRMSVTIASGAGSAGGGGPGSSPYGMGGAGVAVFGTDYSNARCGVGGNGGNGGTASSAVWLARGTVLQIVIGAGGTGGYHSFYSRLRGSAGSAGVIYITG